MPGDLLRDAVQVLVELPGETGLADACDAGDRDEMGLVFVRARMEELLGETQLTFATDERWLEPFRLQASATACGDAERAPERNRLSLALQRMGAGVGERDRGFGRASRRLANEDRARLGDRLHPRGGVDEVACHHPLPGGAEVDGRLTCRYRSAGGELRKAGYGCEGFDGGDEIECRPHRPLGGVLLGDRRTPDGHHRVADELLHLTPVAPDDVGGDLEVAGQEITHLLRVPVLGERREADEVGEENGDVPALDSDRRCVSKSGVVESGSALAAEVLVGLVPSAAPRARDPERCPALGAELSSCSVQPSTRRATCALRDHA